jgi:hypothetical protein
MFFTIKKKIDVNFGASLLFSIFWGLLYLSARLFHVSFYLIPINGGIPWYKSGKLLLAFIGGLIFSIYFYLKRTKKNSGNQ